MTWNKSFQRGGEGQGPDLRNEEGSPKGFFFVQDVFAQVLFFVSYLKDIIDISLGFFAGSEGKESACNAGDLSSILGLGRSPGGGHGNPFQYSCLENPMDGGAWWATAHRATKSDTTEQVSRAHSCVSLRHTAQRFDLHHEVIITMSLSNIRSSQIQTKEKEAFSLWGELRTYSP